MNRLSYAGQWKTVKAIRDYGPGRRCPKCNGKLSRYNPGPGCNQHQNIPIPIEQEGTMACKTCYKTQPLSEFRANSVLWKQCATCRARARAKKKEHPAQKQPRRRPSRALRSTQTPPPGHVAPAQGTPHAGGKKRAEGTR